MAAKIYLPVVTDKDPASDTCLAPAPGMRMPMFIGEDYDESLACGACRTVVARNIATATLWDRYANQSGRLIVTCECGADLLVRISRVG